MPYRSLTRGVLHTVLSVVVATTTAAAADSPVAEAALVIGETRPAVLGGDQADRLQFRFELDGPTYLLVVLDQWGVDARLVLRGPDGEELAVSRGEAGRFSEETLVTVTASGGPHVLEAAMTEDEAGSGEIRLRLVDRHPAGPEDVRRADLERRRLEVLSRLEADEIEAHDALCALRQVADGLGELGDPRRSVALVDAGRVLAGSDVGLAEAAFRQAVALREDLEDAAGVAGALEEIAGLQFGSGRTEEALSTAEEARRWAQAAGDPAVLALVENLRGWLLRRHRDLPAARAAFTVAVEGYARTGDAKNEGIARIGLGLLLRDMYDVAAGCPEVEEGARLARQVRFEDARIELNLGLCQRLRGLGDAAFRTYRRALELAEEEGSRVDQGKALVHLGSLLAQFGDNDQAERELRRALEVLDDGAAEFSAMAHVTLGWVALAEERPADGEREFQLALGSGDAGTEALRGRGEALATQGRHDEALQVLQQALKMARQRQEKRNEGEALRKLGSLHIRMGNLQEARSALAEALRLAGDDRAVEGAVRSDLARLEKRQGHYDEALDHIEQAMDIRESLRGSVSSLELRATYLSRWREDFSLLLTLLLLDDRPAEELLMVSERAHARTLQELLLETRRPSDPPPPELRREQEALQARLDQLVRRQVAEPLSASESDQLQRRIDEVVDELKRIDWRRRSRADDPAAAAPLGLTEIQALLTEREALLEYALGEERSFLFVITRDRLTVHPDLPPADQIGLRVERLRRALRSPNRAWLPGFWRDAHELYRTLVAPAEEELSSVDRLIVVPDRELFYVPFETLVREDPRRVGRGDVSASYALQRWQIAYVPAATVLGQLRTEAGATGGRAVTLVAFADSRGAETMAESRSAAGFGSLPRARQEVEAIAALLSTERTRLFVGAEATEAALRGHPHSRWLHFAVHGFFDARNPSLSGLVMADGELRAREIYDLHLDADMAVLSACETGLGEEVWGEELIGLSRAFFYAGVPTVVVSLWQVADGSTADLMVDFYRRLLAGSAPAAALAGAKRGLIAAGRDHPYYWAPFVVIGNPRSPVTAAAPRRPQS
jgi:CHAT domain-containing protein/Tfp pilus assembly protein PilF